MIRISYMNIIFIKGILAGLLLGIPAGPLGVVAIRKMLTRGPLHGVFFGLGCALVDIIYGSMLGLGVNIIANIITPNQYWISLLGSIFLIAFGIKIFFTNPAVKLYTANNEAEYFSSFIFSFLLALTNPTTILSFTIVFTSLNLGVASIKSLLALQLITGIVIGGAIWWIILSLGIRYLKDRLNPQSLKYLNKFFGVLIIGIVVIIYIYN